MRALVVGSGCCGASAARWLAEYGWFVTVVDRRLHLAGNAYDQKDENGIRYHCYGPHIFFTNKRHIWNFVRRFGKWTPYRCILTVNIDGYEYPMPFQPSMLEKLCNISGIDKRLKLYAHGRKSISVFELIQSNDSILKSVAQTLYEKDCIPYNQKQWGKAPDQLLPEVLGRTPIYVDNQNTFRNEKWQFMPKDGFTAVFTKMLDHPSITTHLGQSAQQWFTLSKEMTIKWVNEKFDVILYTGALDELFNFLYGHLPYRSLKFDMDYVPVTKGLSTFASYFPDIMIPYTRRTDYRYLPGNKKSLQNTLIISEYPIPMGVEDEPYYVILTQESRQLSEKYRKISNEIPHFYTAGRLADFCYYNMDAAIERGLEIAQKIDATERIK